MSYAASLSSKSVVSVVRYVVGIEVPRLQKWRFLLLPVADLLSPGRLHPTP